MDNRLNKIKLLRGSKVLEEVCAVLNRSYISDYTAMKLLGAAAQDGEEFEVEFHSENFIEKLNSEFFMDVIPDVEWYNDIKNETKKDEK